MTIPIAVKFVDGSEDRLRILAFPFSGPFPGGKDTDGEYFSGKTDLCLDWFPDRRPLLFEHGLDGAPGVTVVGYVDCTTTTKSDDGWWVEAQLQKSNAYHGQIKKLIDKSALYGSSGAMPHLVQRSKSGEITRWPWVELSLTPQPANLFAVVERDTVSKHYKSAGIDLDEDALKAKLDAAERNALSDSDYAYIDSDGGRHLPINDAAHVRNALARFDQTAFESAAAKATAHARVMAAAKKFGIDTSEGDSGKSVEPLTLANAAEAAYKSTAALLERTKDVRARRDQEQRDLSPAHKARLQAQRVLLGAAVSEIDGYLASVEAEAKAPPDVLRHLELRHRQLSLQRRG